MSGESDCPELIPIVMAYTSEVTAARPWVIVTGTGPKPDDALQNLRDNAGEEGKALFKLLWEQRSERSPKWRERIAEKARDCASLKATFSIGSTRLAHGESGWVAYGTLFTDSSGDGTGWLQPEGGHHGQ